MITQELIQSLFDYKNGELYYKIRRHGIKIGNKAGSLHHSGYYQIGINGKHYRMHRIIFLYHHGYLPEFIDHIDRDKSNNNIENLRESTRKDNQRNTEPRKNGTSKYKGIHWHKQHQKWYAQITINNKHKFLGLFKSEINAALAYNTAATELFGEYANLNDLGDD